MDSTKYTHQMPAFAFDSRKTNSEQATKVAVDLAPESIKKALELNQHYGTATILIPHSKLADLLTGIAFEGIFTPYTSHSSINLGCIGRIFEVEVEIDSFDAETQYLDQPYVVYYDHNREPIFIESDAVDEEPSEE